MNLFLAQTLGKRTRQNIMCKTFAFITNLSSERINMFLTVKKIWRSMRMKANLFQGLHVQLSINTLKQQHMVCCFESIKGIWATIHCKLTSVT